jgi:dihydroxy-acid dehydratase
VPDDEIERRLAEYEPPDPPRAGVLAKYAALVSSASEGAVTQPAPAPVPSR